MGLYWSARGCNLTAHSSIHAYLILRRGLTRFQLLLRPENNRVQEFFWYSGMRPGCHTDRKHHTFCSKSFVSPDGYPQVPIAGNHRLSLLVNLSSLHHHSLGSIHFKLLTCWVEKCPLSLREMLTAAPLSSYIREVVITA